MKDVCEAELCRRLRDGNALQMLKLAQTYAATKLQEEAETLFMRHFDMLKNQVYDVFEEADDSLEAAGDDTEPDQTVSTPQLRSQSGQI